MKVAIMQPTFLPWIGYFDLMDQVDTFVFLDDVQLSKRSWQQRNRIRTASGLQLLTVPVTNRSGQLIIDASLAEVDFSRKHLKSIEKSYKKAEHFGTYFPSFVEAVMSGIATGRLVELNLSLISWMAGAIGLDIACLRSHELQVSGERSERLALVCERLGADQYLSPLGSKVYLLGELSAFQHRGMTVWFQHYEHPTYRQLYSPFIPFASAIDMLFNEGPASLGIIRSGRRPPLLASDLAQDRDYGGATHGAVSERLEEGE